jgi:hypothetical protein
MDIEKIARNTQDAHLNATWGGSIHVLEELRRHIDIEINKYRELQGNTEIGKTLNKIMEKSNEQKRV